MLLGQPRTFFSLIHRLFGAVLALEETEQQVLRRDSIFSVILFYFSYMAIHGLWLLEGAGQTWTEKSKGPWEGWVQQRVRWAA